MSRGPIKIREMTARLPQAGRIRLGKKVPTSSGKSRPQKLRTFRFTSKDSASIERVASLYGGTVEPWSDPLAAPGQWQVETDAEEIRIALPPDPLGESSYELWSGGGCQRRCDGEVCTLQQGSGPDGAEPTEVPCLCARRGELECKITTRLQVILPDVRFLGTWRIDTKGMNAAQELPGMVAGVQAMESRGFTRAVLRLDYRVETSGGKRKEFVVPVIGVDATPDELAAGTQRLGQISHKVPALETPGCPGCASVYSLHDAGCPNITGGHELDVVLAETERRADDFIDVVAEPEPVALTEHAGSAPGPLDPELVQAWLESLTNSQRAVVLVKARNLADTLGQPPPTRWEEIPLEVADALMGNGTP